MTKVASLWGRSPGTNLSRWIPIKNISTAAKILQAHTMSNTTPQETLLPKQNEVLLWTEGTTSWTSCLAYRTKTCFATQMMQRHLSHQSLFPLSVKVNHSACTEWADDLQIKNKSAVSWPLNADLSLGGQMYLYFFHAGETLVSLT